MNMGHLLIVCFLDAVLTLSTVINHLMSLSMGGTKVLQDCYVSLMESCIQLKEVQDNGDNDDDEDEDTEDDDEVTEMKTLLCTFSCHA